MMSLHAFQQAAPIDPIERQNEIFLIDGSGFIFRAFHALPPLSRADGTPVNAVLGFTNMLMRLITEMHVPNIAVVFDAARRNFRNDIYPEYKANRTETPPDLIPQFSLIRAATKAFSVPALEQEGYEADDLIATYTRLAREQGRLVTIVSSDKDLMQLLRPGVRMFDPLKYRYIAEAEVFEKFGVPAEKVVDVQALAGDSTDNVPGVPGIGLKTAAQLIQDYGDLEGVLNNAAQVKQPKRREALIQNAELARVSKKLVQLQDRVDVMIPISELSLRVPDRQVLFAFLQEQGFKSIQTRLEKKFEADKEIVLTDKNLNHAISPENKEPVYTLVQDLEVLQTWIRQAFEKGIVAIDTETTSLTPAKADLVGVSLSVTPGAGCYIPVGHRLPERQTGTFDFSMENKEAVVDLRQLPIDAVMSALKTLLEDSAVLKVGHNIKYDLQMFLRHGIQVSPIDDTMLLSYVLDGTSHSHGMDELSESFLDHKTIKYEDVTGTGRAQVTFDLVPLDKALVYAAEDADVTLRLHNLFKPRLPLERMVTVYETLERPLASVIAKMEDLGVKIDVQALRKLGQEFATSLRKLEEEIQTRAGCQFNVASPKQLGEVLFEHLKLPGGKKTKTGAWSTNADVLEDLAEQGHDIVVKIVEWRELAKLQNTYVEALPAAICPRTERLHTSFSMAGTNTGRLSSSDPNLQNIPIRTENGRKIRAAFIPEKGYTFLSADYSQVELRLAADMAKVSALIQAFQEGIDIHTATASQVFGIPVSEVGLDLRRQAKAINFGIIYGISGFGLARQLNIPQAEASEYIRRYLARFPELKAFMEAQKEQARRQGYVRTLYGRKCYIRGINDKNSAVRNFAERQAMNAPLQGTAADIMKRAMVALPSALAQAGLEARMLLQVHDELLFEVPENEKDKMEIVVTDVMEKAAVNVTVPLKVGLGWGKNWAEAH